ncbi:MAG: RNA polymerase sigma factor [bacterium]|nr:RNA polymerase sigma factor [bacterium]
MEQQFLQAYDAYGDAIFRHCYFRVFRRDRAKELSQEVFIRVWEYLSAGKKIENIRAFLYRVANNLIIDESRKRKEWSLDALQEEGFDPKSPVDPSRRNAILEGKFALEKIEHLDAKYREVVIMRYIDDLQPKEIAQILGESENVVSVRIHRGVKQLREIINHHHANGMGTENQHV